MTEKEKGWVFYDADCAICTGWAERLHGLLARRGLHPVPLQSAWALQKLGVPGGREDDLHAKKVGNAGPLHEHAPSPQPSPPMGERERNARAGVNDSRAVATVHPLLGERAGVRAGENDEMKFLTRDGRIFGGADAIIQITKYIWWAWPFYLVAQIPGAKPLLRHAYRILAANRHCIAGKCRVHAQLKKPARTTISFLELP